MNGWRRWAFSGALCGVAAVTGCGKAPVAQFRLNMQGLDPDEFNVSAADEENKATVEANAAARKQIASTLFALFGAPDAPEVPEELGLDKAKIELAAGPSVGDATGKQRGLYRENCVHCHGVTGDGAGTTAPFLNPYPRDFRMGVFKFKATERAAKPRTADLKRTLMDGIHGTAMPSFALLPAAEVDALVEYVKYLSIRGEVEMLMANQAYVAGDELPTDRAEIMDSFVTPVVDQWTAADDQVIEIAEAPTFDISNPSDEVLAKGRELFLGAKAQCTKCHGPTGLGDGGEEDLFDDWNKSKTSVADLQKQLAAIDQSEATKGRDEQINSLERQLAIVNYMWDLPKAEIDPRNLRLNIYRFGRRPEDLFRRLYAGINGTPMPAGGASPSNPAGLTADEIWHVVAYVRSLPYEPASKLYGAPEPAAHDVEQHTAQASSTGGATGG